MHTLRFCQVMNSFLISFVVAWLRTVITSRLVSETTRPRRNSLNLIGSIFTPFVVKPLPPHVYYPLSIYASSLRHTIFPLRELLSFT